MFLSTCKNAPVVFKYFSNFQTQSEIFIFTLGANKRKFEQKEFGEKDKRWHTIHSCSQRKKEINIQAVDIRVNKIFINLAPNVK